jgi:hypothetical protein
MIIIDAIVLHTATTVLTFGSNSNSLAPGVLENFVDGYSVMEKIQMVGFFLQELIISVIYIKETIRLLKLHESISKVSDGGDVASVVDEGNIRSLGMRKTMYQLIAINAIIIAMDIALLGVEFANLYLVETTLKGVVYSIKLKLEFAVLGKLVQLVRTHTSSDHQQGSLAESPAEDSRGVSTGLTLEKMHSGTGSTHRPPGPLRLPTTQHYPEFVDPSRISSDITHADRSMSIQGRSLSAVGEDGEGTVEQHMARERGRRRSRVQSGSWIEEEMDKHNIG